jgi:hypothetical protein
LLLLVQLYLSGISDSSASFTAELQYIVFWSLLLSAEGTEGST